MITPAQILSSPAVRYQQAINNMLRFWNRVRVCKTCSYQSDIKHLIQQVKALIKN
jgi:phosphohistidine phosphatase SixA